MGRAESKEFNMSSDRYDEYMAQFRKDTAAKVRDRQRERGVNISALSAINIGLAAQAESERWTAAGLLAQFRNWRNRR